MIFLRFDARRVVDRAEWVRNENPKVRERLKRAIFELQRRA